LEVIFDLPSLQRQISELEEKSSSPNFWDDPTQANLDLKRLSRYKDIYTPFAKLRKTGEDLAELYEMLHADPSPELEKEADSMAKAFLKDLDKYELETLLSGEHELMREQADRKPVTGPQCYNACTPDGRKSITISWRSSAKIPGT
jgi:peptide chain release factor 2